MCALGTCHAYAPQKEYWLLLVCRTLNSISLQVARLPKAKDAQAERQEDATYESQATKTLLLLSVHLVDAFYY